jgi:hypothetical protein
MWNESANVSNNRLIICFFEVTIYLKITTKTNIIKHIKVVKTTRI